MMHTASSSTEKRHQFVSCPNGAWGWSRGIFPDWRTSGFLMKSSMNKKIVQHLLVLLLTGNPLSGSGTGSGRKMTPAHPLKVGQHAGLLSFFLLNARRVGYDRSDQTWSSPMCRVVDCWSAHVVRIFFLNTGYSAGSTVGCLCLIFYLVSQYPTFYFCNTLPH